MTREEAIQVLQKSTDNTIEMTIREWEEFDKEVAEAIDMAIEALSADAVEVVQCGNCIWYDGRSKGCNRSGGLTMYPLHEYDFCSYIERIE